MKIEPCPFCSTEDTELYKSMTTDLHWVFCKEPGCQAIGASRHTESEAIEAWNEVSMKVHE